MNPQDQFQISTQEIIERAHTLRARAFRLMVRTAWHKITVPVKALIRVASHGHLIRRSA